MHWLLHERLVHSLPIHFYPILAQPVLAHRQSVAVQDDVARCGELELLELVVDRPPVQQKPLARKIVDTVRFPQLHVRYCFVQWEALRIESDEAIHDGPPLHGFVKNRVLAKDNDFDLTVSDE
eukprot:Mycagemm_TRINITY_DN10911_c0_g1::TRINITY_DN10911_c0_g1_i1::g.399::m.399 type:complete len:123 gc:universal TRINITY_DN10911_c0_g1_i1:542-910(+)